MKSNAPSFKGLNGSFDVAVSGDNGDRHATRVFLHPFDEFQTVAVRQSHVSQADIKALPGQLRFGTFDVSCYSRIYVHALKRERQQFARCRVRRR